MVTPQERENKLFELLADSRTTNELAVAALTIVLLEHIVNFADEVNMIWKSRFSISSAAYIWIRYFTLVVLWCGRFIIFHSNHLSTETFQHRR
ncbi:hypothetical protein B0H13DRAFT_513047 [Mycena leptocephala]|nr:hypothetical protein B0H13DRAFT_513047 [Mycena leptocephala]